MFLCTVASKLRNDAICQLVYQLRKDTVAIRQGTHILETDRGISLQKCRGVMH